MRALTRALAAISAAVLGLRLPSLACPSILVGREASADGSVMISCACDGEFHPHLRSTPGRDHDEGPSST
jgi:hypothetical protein